ncbi:MAG: flagellar hook capping protein [Actinobacteria bacterium]|nr:flagellar hook capping protein [Actinomycetota bacterium]
MTTPIGSTTPPGSAAQPTSGSGHASNTLDGNAFLTLLVAQLKYQDPSKPADSTAFLAETAQFTQVEKLEALVTAGQQQVVAAQIASATNLVGHSISYTTADGTPGTGVVTSATFTGGTPSLRVGTAHVPLSTVTEVRSSAG